MPREIILKPYLFEDIFNEEQLEQLYNERVGLSPALGKDGVNHSIFKSRIANEIEIILAKTDNGTYTFTNYKEKLISKGAGKFPRMISIPTIRDRLTLSAVNLILTSHFQSARTRKPHYYIKCIKECLSSSDKAGAFIRIDVKDFYPTINHRILNNILLNSNVDARVNELVMKAITTGTGSTNKTSIGIPQGLSISNILASIYLMKLDFRLEKKFHYYRYVDDILIISKKSEAPEIFKSVCRSLAYLKLKAHKIDTDGKSNITTLAKGIDYLGYKISKSQISVRKSSYLKMIDNILTVLTKYKHSREGVSNLNQLVWRLNLKISGCIFNNKRYGWMFFFSQIDDKSQLHRLDHLLEKEIKRREIDIDPSQLKKFIRSYHEIRYNFNESQYIPRFDDLSTDEMIDILMTIEIKTRKFYEDKYYKRENSLKTRFYKRISRETRSLEEDLIDSNS